MQQARILVVDDDVNHLAAVERVLRRSRLEVSTAHSGRMGLRAAVRTAPDLVLVDVSMPTMSGHEFLRRFRRLQGRGIIGAGSRAKGHLFHEIPIIFLTALSAVQQRVSGLDIGAVDYITKPYEPDELRARVRGHLRRARRHNEILSRAQSSPYVLESSSQRCLEAIRECRRPMVDLETYLDLAEYVLQPALRRRMLQRAHRDLWQLKQTLALVAQAHSEMEATI